MGLDGSSLCGWGGHRGGIYHHCHHYQVVNKNGNNLRETFQRMPLVFVQKFVCLKPVRIIPQLPKRALDIVEVTEYATILQSAIGAASKCQLRT